ncbi:kinase-like domain-containing protein [Amanita rubescens]|nr:kinase-like domain-containing protein [Amanita rubescens]
MANKIRSLIEENEMREKDTQFDQTRPPLSLLLAILRIELTARRVNRITLNLICKLLELPDYQTITSELKTTGKVELFLDFILCLLSDASLADCGVKDANKKVRRLMSKLCKTGVLPKSLFLSKVELSRDTVGTGGKLVALKVLYRARHKEFAKDPLRKNFCREALVWRSLSHRFILPLLGIYEHKSQLYLVSPFMKNGTLIQWRKSRPDTLEIYRVMLEVAKGIQYIHSEGIVHGDLSGGNVLLDSEFHCRITDFGLTQYVEATVSRTSNAISVNYAAPELLGICNKCWQHECPGCGEQRRGKTKETDMYAFGCLYYAVFFGILPFQDKSEAQITWLVASGRHPSRLDQPRIDDGVWNLIERCWMRNSSERPTIERLISAHSTFAVSVLTALITKLKALGLPVVNDDTLRLICNLLDSPDYLTVVSELTTPRNVELLLDFILPVISSSGPLVYVDCLPRFSSSANVA